MRTVCNHLLAGMVSLLAFVSFASAQNTTGTIAGLMWTPHRPWSAVHTLPFGTSKRA